MKNKTKIFTFFLGILISIFGSFFVSQLVFSANTEVNVLGGLSGATPEEIQQNADFNQVIGNIIGGALSFIAVIFFVLVVYGGFLWMTASGNEDQAKKGRDTVIASVIGVIIIMSSYTLVQFIFTSIEGTKTTTVGSSNACEEYNPNWKCMNIRECAGASNLKNLTDKETECTDNSNCITDKCEDSVLVCCLPYQSFCETNYTGYTCVADQNECTSGVVRAAAEEESLCDSTRDSGEYCCESRVVWGYDLKNTRWSNEAGKEGQISDKEGEGFICTSTKGFFETPSGISNSVWSYADNLGVVTGKITKSDIAKYQFDSESECAKYGETEKIFCLKYSRDFNKYYCTELLKGDDTRDCAKTYNRLYNAEKMTDPNIITSLNDAVSCIEAQDYFNNELK